MKILIVEDEPGITGFLKQGLEEDGYEVLIAETGDTGLQMALHDAPGLILLDWMLPGLSGIEVCRAIREKGSSVPILFLTAKDTVQETIEGLKAGANDYIKKPFSFEELLERIKIHTRYTNAPNDITISKTRLSLSAHKVFQEGNEVTLTQREFELLAYLMKNRGTACTRQQIIRDVWDIHFDYDTGVIDVFINAIRKKLHLKKEDDFIKTIRGIGYIAEEN